MGRKKSHLSAHCHLLKEPHVVKACYRVDFTRRFVKEIKRMNESLKDSIKEANEISLDSLKDKLDKSKERVEKTKQQLLNANNEYRSTFLENIKSQLSSPTVWSIVTDYKALENRKK